MSPYLLIALASLVPVGLPTLPELDGPWSLVGVARNGGVLQAANVPLTVGNGRLVLGGLVLDLGADRVVRRWDPQPAPPARIVYPYTWEQWVRRTGDPVYSPGCTQWVIDRVSGGAITVGPMPCYVVQPPPPDPLTIVGSYTLTGDRLTIQLMPTDASSGSGLSLVLEKPLPQPRRIP